MDEIFPRARGRTRGRCGDYARGHASDTITTGRRCGMGDHPEAWAAIKAAYIEQTAGVRELAQEYGISESRIYKRASREGWKRSRDKLKAKTEETYINRRARARAEEMERISSAADRMARLLDTTIAAMEQQPPEAVCTQLKGLSALGSAIKSTVDSLMLLNGLQSKAQIEAQKIARARLRLEERKAKREEMAENNSGKAQQVELVIRRESEDEDEQIRRIRELCEDPEPIS